ncbi:MAG: DUF2806 domain-containing protein [Bifidobacterium mongoliense]|uniref:DUF2806 domain-containing protein n=1 Tax=Bifidobacterium mongoliense TaxID=518643 RepID=UPI002F35F55B
MDSIEQDALKYGSDAIIKGAGVVSKLFPEIPMGSFRRGIRRDADELTASLVNIDANKNLSEYDKTIIKCSLYKNLGHIDNLEEIISVAIPLMNDTATGEGVDPDWIDDFQDKAGRCSNPELQKLWAQILAGEINEPSTYPKRLLSVLSTLDKNEAESFKKLCSYSARQYDMKHPDVISPVIYIFMNQDTAQTDTYNDGTLSIDQNESLIEAGLVSANTWNVIHSPVNSMRTLVTSTNMILISNNNTVAIDFTPAHYMFTKAGQALATLCDLGNAQNFKSVLRNNVPPQLSIGVTALGLEPGSQPLTYL